MREISVMEYIASNYQSIVNLLILNFFLLCTGSESVVKHSKKASNKAKPTKFMAKSITMINERPMYFSVKNESTVEDNLTCNIYSSTDGGRNRVLDKTKDVPYHEVDPNTCISLQTLATSDALLQYDSPELYYESLKLRVRY